MYSRFSGGGAYRGFENLSTLPSDTIKNGAWDWKQYHVPIAIDGLTLIKVDQPMAIANLLTTQFAQAEMEMAAFLGAGIYTNTVTNDKEIDGLQGEVDDGGVATTYAGLLRSANSWWNSYDDSTSTVMTPGILQTAVSSVGKGGRQPTLIVSRQEQYNRYWALGMVDQSFPVQPGGHDEQLHSAGFTNQLFNGISWVVDDYMFDGPNTTNSGILILNEDYIRFAVSPRADFYLQPFQTPVGQDAMVSQLFWAGNLLVLNCARQGKITALAA